VRQQRSRLGPQALDDVQPVGAAEQRLGWVVAHLRLQAGAVIVGKVRQVGDERGAAGRDGCDLGVGEEVRDPELHVEPEALRVGLGDGQRVRLHVGGPHLRISPLGLDGESDSAAASADVEHGHGSRREVLQHQFDEALRLGARDEDGGRDRQFQTVERRRPDDVLNGLAHHAPLQHRREADAFRVEEGPVGVERLLEPAEARHGLDEHRRFRLGALDACASQTPRAQLASVGDREPRSELRGSPRLRQV